MTILGKKLTFSPSIIIMFMALVMALVFVSQGQAKVDPADIAAIWLYDEGAGNTVKDQSGKGHNGNIVGGKWVKDSLRGDGALEFNGKSDRVTVANSNFINNAIVTKRAIMALFKCKDVSKGLSQTIYEEGGTARGFNIYVESGKLYVGGWNSPEYGWQGAWPSVPIKSNEWYFAALVLRNGQAKVEKDKLEMWVNGRLISKHPGGQLFPHGSGIGMGAVNWDTVFNKNAIAGTNIHHFEGIIDEVRIYNTPLEKADIAQIVGNLFLAVEPSGKLATAWGSIRSIKLMRE